jgi:hypothetical protein
MLVVQLSYRTRGAYYETVHVFVSLALDTDFNFEAALSRFIYLRCMVSICSCQTASGSNRGDRVCECDWVMEACLFQKATDTMRRYGTLWCF